MTGYDMTTRNDGFVKKPAVAPRRHLDRKQRKKID